MNERLKGTPGNLEGLKFGPNNPLTPEVMIHITPVQVAVLFQQLVEEPEVLGGLITPGLVKKLKTESQTAEALKKATVALFGGLPVERIEELIDGLRKIRGEQDWEQILDDESGFCIVPMIHLIDELQRRQRQLGVKGVLKWLRDKV